MDLVIERRSACYARRAGLAFAVGRPSNALRRGWTAGQGPECTDDYLPGRGGEWGQGRADLPRACRDDPASARQLVGCAGRLRRERVPRRAVVRGILVGVSEPGKGSRRGPELLCRTVEVRGVRRASRVPVLVWRG